MTPAGARRDELLRARCREHDGHVPEDPVAEGVRAVSRSAAEARRGVRVRGGAAERRELRADLLRRCAVRVASQRGGAKHERVPVRAGAQAVPRPKVRRARRRRSGGARNDSF